MFVELISYSQPPPCAMPISMAELVGFCARVSNPDNQSSHSTTPRLLAYLRDHKHWSPFEMVNVCLAIETTRDIARQMLRHRSFSFQEFSQRYAVADTEFVYRSARMQDPVNRQASLPCTDAVLADEWLARQQALACLVNDTYEWALDNGIAKEQARAVLPEGLTISRMYMNGTLRSWIHYLDLRSANGTQQEHSEIAVACAAVISKIYAL